MVDGPFFLLKVTKHAKIKKHTTADIRWWSPTQLLICRSEAYVWQSGRGCPLFLSLWSYVMNIFQ